MTALLDAVLFDAGGVLVVPDPAALAPAAAPLRCRSATRGRHPGPLRRHAGPGRRGRRARRLGPVPDRAYVRRPGVPADRAVEAAAALLERVVARTCGATRCHESVAALARAPRARASRSASCRTPAVRSRACWPSRASARSVRARACRCACVVDSDVVGVMKPDPAIFGSRSTCSASTPERVGYVGDSVRNDVRGRRGGRPRAAAPRPLRRPPRRHPPAPPQPARPAAARALTPVAAAQNQVEHQG